ncbi:MAG: hypothetical protein S4CHLAM102_14120 [Chlamydiia bacterium]|nr:hypothetical protein [Chlamydiia bacterium]
MALPTNYNAAQLSLMEALKDYHMHEWTSYVNNEGSCSYRICHDGKGGFVVRHLNFFERLFKLFGNQPPVAERDLAINISNITSIAGRKGFIEKKVMQGIDSLTRRHISFEIQTDETFGIRTSYSALCELPTELPKEPLKIPPRDTRPLSVLRAELLGKRSV